MPVDSYNQAFSDAHSTKYSDKLKEDELGSLWLKFDITWQTHLWHTSNRDIISPKKIIASGGCKRIADRCRQRKSLLSNGLLDLVANLAIKSVLNTECEN